MALLALAVLVGAPLARADGDPASDVLLSASLFIPPEVPVESTKPLDAVVRDATAHGYAIRVALIGSEYDLGAVSVLYKQPKRYARFLGQELTFVYRGPLLIVMPNGLAISRNGKLIPREQSVVERIAAPGTNGASLAAAATRAVVRLAAASGVAVSAPPLFPAHKADTSRERVIIVVVTMVAITLGVIISFVRRRRST